MLRASKCRPAEATDAWECLEMLRSAAGTVEAFDLALIDFQMPEMDGGQLAEEIKKDARFTALPLLLLTSMPQHGDAARLMGLGFSAHLTKPIRQAVLRDALVTVVRGRPRAGGHLSLVKPTPRPAQSEPGAHDRGRGRGTG